VVGQAVVEELVPETVLMVAVPEEVDEAATEEEEAAEEELELELELILTAEEELLAIEEEEALELLLVVLDMTTGEAEAAGAQIPHWVPQKKQLNQL
jgi:hypothetical protein